MTDPGDCLRPLQAPPGTKAAGSSSLTIKETWAGRQSSSLDNQYQYALMTYSRADSGLTGANSRKPLETRSLSSVGTCGQQGHFIILN
jgi:hypothetical protein